MSKQQREGWATGCCSEGNNTPADKVGDISLFWIRFTGPLSQPVEKNTPVFPCACASLLCGYCRSVTPAAKWGEWSPLFSSGAIMIKIFDVFYEMKMLSAASRARLRGCFHSC